MKKIITFLITFLIGIFAVNAVEISGVYCTYDLGNVYGKIIVSIEDYNTETPTVKVECQDKDTYGYIEANMYKCRGATTNKPTVMLKHSKDSYSFVNQYKKNMSCPSLYINDYEKSDGDDKYTYIETVDISSNIDTKIDSSIDRREFKLAGEAKLVGEKKKEVGSDDYKDAEDIKLPKKEDKPCKYDMNFDRTNRVIPWMVRFVTSYDENNNYKEIYKIKISGRADYIVDLNKDADFSLGAYQSQKIHVSKEQLQKIFLYEGDGCMPGEEIFHYTYKRDEDQTNITTDEKEARDESVGGKYDNGAGSKGGTGATGKLGAETDDPSITGFGDTGDECKKVLGETLSALVKEAIKWVRIFGGIIAIVNATLKLVPAIMSKDAEALNKALKTCVIMAIILVFCILFGWMLNLIGKLFKWDVTCIV